jgi:hypothetical protein
LFIFLSASTLSVSQWEINFAAAAENRGDGGAVGDGAIAPAEAGKKI